MHIWERSYTPRDAHLGGCVPRGCMHTPFGARTSLDRWTKSITASAPRCRRGPTWKELLQPQPRWEPPPRGRAYE